MGGMGSVMGGGGGSNMAMSMSMMQQNMMQMQMMIQHMMSMSMMGPQHPSQMAGSQMHPSHMGMMPGQARPSHPAVVVAALARSGRPARLQPACCCSHSVLLALRLPRVRVGALLVADVCCARR